MGVVYIHYEKAMLVISLRIESFNILEYQVLCRSAGAGVFQEDIILLTKFPDICIIFSLMITHDECFFPDADIVPNSGTESFSPDICLRLSQSNPFSTIILWDR
jgi:hypothetical protein